MAEIVSGLPYTLSALRAARTFVSNDVAYTLSIADLPFMMAGADPNNPYMRATADWRRQQFDNSKEAGEQSLDQAQWIRSQNSWHRGAGINFYEPGADEGTEFRFNSSLGVDVWTQGQATLLHSMEKPITAIGYQGVVGAIVDDTDYLFANSNGTLVRSDGSITDTYSGVTTCSGAPVVAGGKVLVGSTTGLWNGDPEHGTSALTHQITTSGAPLIPFFVKSRLVLAQGNVLYAEALSASSLGTPIYTHPDPTFTWSSISETTDAILAAGYSNGFGAIYRFSIEDPGGGGTPVLSSAFQIADFPPGEEVHAIKTYLGTYIAIGTSRGLRVGIITGGTSVSPTVIQYGPLLFQTLQPVTALTAADNFIYAGVTNQLDGNSGVVRVSLEAQIPNSQLRFPWAYDVNTHVTGNVDSMALFGSSGRVVVGVNGRGVYLESTTGYESSGFIQFGNIRFATSENKAFRLGRIRASYPTGGITLTTIAPNGAEALIARVDGTSASDDDLAITRPSGQFEFLGFKLTLDSDTHGTPILNSFQVKALPAPRKQRLITYQVLLDDQLKDQNGTQFGGEGFAAACLLAVEELESVSAVVQIKDADTGEAYQGTIDHQQFVRNGVRQKNGPNFGGLLTVVVRKL